MCNTVCIYIYIYIYVYSVCIFIYIYIYILEREREIVPLPRICRTKDPKSQNLGHLIFFRGSPPRKRRTSLN